MARILVIEDQPSVRSLIRSLLEDDRHTVIEAANGRAGILVPTDLYDLVITDILMPEMDGLEVIRHLKRACPDVPVLVVSGGWRNRSPDLLSIAGTLGADLTLDKAKVPTELLPAVTSLLQRRSL